MLGRDKITVHFRDRSTNAEFSRTVYGTVVTEQLDGKVVEPMPGRPVFANFYRVIVPRSVQTALAVASVTSIDFAGRETAYSRFENGLTPIYDGRGRVRHYEGVVRSS
ncbi:hypothetical protein [Mycolicibacterium mengxianglii]|uniref:hypothetical protein n=1 Tax=Mycolicibacterium mengxianglii TaxID=2736649 RepID=UPI0018EF3167|nr:hypothetical protein [Mycolicibacterium mengxianglii]